jgi:hypothetical protein
MSQDMCEENLVEWFVCLFGCEPEPVEASSSQFQRVQASLSRYYVEPTPPPVYTILVLQGSITGGYV